MTYQPAVKTLQSPLIIHPWGRYGTRNDVTVAGNTPLSQAWPSANLAKFYPLYLEESVLVQKMFWLNGATASTNNIDIGAYLMTDLTTGRLDAIRTAGPILAANANVVQATSAWRVAQTGLTSGNSTVDGTTFTTASVTLKAGRLYLLSFTNTKATTPDAASSVQTAGAAVSFTSVATSTFNTIATPTQRVSVFRAMPAADVTDTIVITFGGTATGCAWSLMEFSGVDQSGTNGSGAIVQSVVATATDSGTSVTATLSAFGNVNNCTYGATASNSAAITQGTGFTEIHEQTYSTPTARLETEWRVDNSTTVSQSWTGNSAAQVIGVEIKADTSSFVLPMGQVFLGLASSGTSNTTMFAQAPSTAQERPGGSLQAATSMPLPSSVVPVLTVSAFWPVAGFSQRTLLD